MIIDIVAVPVLNDTSLVPDESSVLHVPGDDLSCPQEVKDGTVGHGSSFSELHGATFRSEAGELGLEPLETTPDGERHLSCDDPAEILSKENGSPHGACPADTPVLPCSPVVSGAAVVDQPWNDRDLSEHSPEGSYASAPVLHNPTASDMHMMHGICSKKKEACALADSAPGADCWA